MARSSADCWVKLPEISALPLSVVFTWGAETTSPSRAMANWFCGGCCAESFWVIVWNCLEPFLENSMLTIHMPRCWSKPALAFSTSVPETSAGPRTYLASPSELHATTMSVGLAPSAALAREALLEQSSSANCFCSLAAAAWSAADADGVASAFGVVLALGVGEESAVRAPVTARPWVVALALGVADDFPLSDAEALGLADGLGLPDDEALGVGVGVPWATVSTGRK